QLESIVEHFRHLRVGGAVRSAQQYRQQAVAAAARRRDQTAEGLLGPPGFQSVGSGVRVQQLVVVDQRIGLVHGRRRKRDGGRRGDADQCRVMRLEVDATNRQVSGGGIVARPVQA